MNTTEKPLTEKELCERLGICRLTAMRLRRDGLLGYCQIGRKIVYLPQHVEKFLSDSEQNTTPRGIESLNLVVEITNAVLMVRCLLCRLVILQGDTRAFSNPVELHTHTCPEVKK